MSNEFTTFRSNNNNKICQYPQLDLFSTVFTPVLIDPVYKSTPYFDGQNLSFLYFWVRVFLENNLVLIRIFFQVVWSNEKNHSKFEHEVYYHAYASVLAGFNNTCICGQFCP